MSDTPISSTLPFAPIRILLVEDDDGCALLMKTILTRWRFDGFTLRRVVSLSEAVREVLQGGFDIILLDLGLPDSFGFGTFVRMREAAAGIPIIVLSGLDDEALASKAVSQGAQDYIIKGGTDGSALARAIRYAVERCRAQQALVEEHDLLRGLLDSIPDQVYLKDKDSRFVAVNPATARFFGAASPAEIVGKSDYDFFPHELAAQFQAEEQTILYRDQPCVNREAAITDAAGRRRWVLTTKVPLRDHTGGITGLLGINRDISERKESEEAIRRINEELEQRVNERTDALRKAMARLEAEDRARAEFVSSVSHELRSPLTTMKFAVANLLDGLAGPVPASVKDYLRMLDDDCRRMADTVEDILDFSRLENKMMSLHRSRLPLDRLLRKAAADLEVQAHRRHIEVVLSIAQEGLFAECDAIKMLRVIINVVGNAIKFTPDGGWVELGLRREGADAGFLMLDVTDNGIGIAPEHLPRVCEKYFRAGENTGGTGLGLAIAREIVALHGGRLVVQSPPPARERGTRVSITLPAAAPPVILMASDDATTASLLKQHLGTGGYRVVACSARGDVMDALCQAKPDVLVLDTASIGFGVAELVVRIKAAQDVRRVPVVALLEGSEDSSLQAVLKGLSVPVMPKPWREDELLDRIEELIRCS